MHEFLPVRRIPLVRVVHHQLPLVREYERLPDGRQAVVRQRFAAGCDVRHEFPAYAGIGARVQVDLGVAEVCWDGVSCGEDGAGRVPCEGFVEEVEEGLVAEAPVVDLVLDLGDLGPRDAAVAGAVDREVDEGWFGGVVLPGGEEVVVWELDGAGVEDLGVGVVTWGSEDGYVCEC